MSAVDTPLGNRTTVRPAPFSIRLVRLGFRALSTVAPGAAESIASQLFFVPRRSSRAVPPVIAGLASESFTVESGAQRIAAWSWGHGPAVILAHGWEGWAGQLAGFVTPLVAAGYRAVAFDMPAHGRSSGRTVDVLRMAGALKRVARAVAPVHGVIGHSMGGTATAIAMFDGLKAERIVLIAPGAEPWTFARRAAAELGLSAVQAEGMIRRILERLGGSWVEMYVPNLVRGLSRPMILMHDPADLDVPWEHGEAIARSWPGARMIQLQGLGHRRMLRDPASIDTAVRFVAAPATGRLSQWAS